MHDRKGNPSSEKLLMSLQNDGYGELHSVDALQLYMEVSTQNNGIQMSKSDILSST